MTDDLRRRRSFHLVDGPFQRQARSVSERAWVNHCAQGTFVRVTEACAALLGGRVTFRRSA
jgi:hypothetical protein